MMTRPLSNCSILGIETEVINPDSNTLIYLNTALRRLGNFWVGVVVC
jgi:hypothetical protein